jgi:hypothetical protein
MTTQRRPHWDDDLVRTVADLIQHGEQGVMDYVHRAHIIIAAVEDWQDDNGLGRIGQLLGERQSAINESIELRERITYLEAKLAGFDTAY